jgi:hypothetical protein
MMLKHPVFASNWEAFFFPPGAAITTGKELYGAKILIRAQIFRTMPVQSEFHNHID